MTGALIGSEEFGGTPAEVTRARHWLRTLLKGHPQLDDIELCGSEIITNAVRHSESAKPGGTLTVIVIGSGPRVRVEVVDDGSLCTGPEVRGDLYADNGHGLRLVQALSATWGDYTDQHGRTVWFEVTRS